MPRTETAYQRPPLKWPGGKYRLLPRIQRHLCRGQRLVEPFAGSAVVSLNTPYPAHWINDVNADLITFLRVLRDDGGAFIDHARQWFQPAYNNEAAYYEARATFNATADPVTKAALLLYINKHGFNGLIRYNAAGLLNVPFGRYAGPAFPEEALRLMHRRLQGATLTSQPFEAVFAGLQEGDVVYCDPPYVPLSVTADFTTYAAGGFGLNEQERLALLATEAARAGRRVVISNHDTPITQHLYARGRKYRFPVRRTISRDASNRAEAKELLAVFTPRIVEQGEKRHGPQSGR